MDTIEEKIYTNYAFDKFSKEKREMNLSLLDRLHSQYKIKKINNSMFITKKKKEQMAEMAPYDIVFEGGDGNNSAIYFTIYKNAPGLSEDELALICDKGNLCFGYKMDGTHLTVYID